MNYVLLTATSELRRQVNALKREINSTDPAATNVIEYHTNVIDGLVAQLEKEVKDGE